MFESGLGATLVVALLLSALQVCADERDISCPKGCSCKPLYVSSIMRCRDLPPATDGVVPVSHLEIIRAEHPLLMGEAIFASAGLRRLESITISNSSVLDIERNAFNELDELADLKITHTNISRIHPDAFVGNANLRKLSLANNPLGGNNPFIVSESLEELDMSGCNMTSIKPDIFSKVPYLTSLDLSRNNISALTVGTFDPLEDIIDIHLENNHISEFPEGIFAQNFDLEHLYLDGNPLSNISYKMFPYLDTLSLRSCKLRTLQKYMFGTENGLTNLDVSGNAITTIGAGTFDSLPDLVTINMAGNDLPADQVHEHVFASNLVLEKIILDGNERLGALPTNGFKTYIGAAYNVYWFSCRHCGLGSLPADTFSTMPDIVTLLLSHNSISDIRTGALRSLNALNDLDLSHNRISTMDNDTFANNEYLRTLNLAGNPLKTLHASIFRRNVRLDALDLSGCGLFKLWTSRKGDRLSSIQNLNVSHNRISLIRKEDVQITDRLKSLDLSGNDIACTDSYKALVEYLTTNEIQNSEYVTHEKMAYTFGGPTDEIAAWRDQAVAKCPQLWRAQVEADADIDDNIDIDDDAGYDDDDQLTVSDDELGHPPPVYFESRHADQYSYLWLILVFLGAALATLGIVANAILFVVRRRQKILVPRIINVRAMSKLKKNSGLVYQQLSEERDLVKTPVLGRFMPVPSVHQPNAPEHV